MKTGSRELLFLACAFSVMCHAVWGAVSGLLFGTFAAALWLAILQMAAVELFVRRPGSRLRDSLAGVLAPAVIGVAISVAIRGPATTTRAAFGVAIVVAH